MINIMNVFNTNSLKYYYDPTRQSIYLDLINKFSTAFTASVSNGYVVSSSTITLLGLFGDNKGDSVESSFNTRKSILNLISNNFISQKQFINQNLQNFNSFFGKLITLRQNPIDKVNTNSIRDMNQFTSNLKTFISKISQNFDFNTIYSASNNDTSIKLYRYSNESSPSFQSIPITNDLNATMLINNKLSSNLVQDFRFIQYSNNPFIFTTTVNYTVSQSSVVDIEIYDGTTNTIITDLKFPVTLFFKSSNLNQTSQCKFFDPVVNYWDNKGLVSNVDIKNKFDKILNCSTTHFTVFGAFDQPVVLYDFEPLVFGLSVAFIVFVVFIILLIIAMLFIIFKCFTQSGGVLVNLFN
jgi:hypothetical protein